jgi:hypothetical protein
MPTASLYFASPDQGHFYLLFNTRYNIISFLVKPLLPSPFSRFQAPGLPIALRLVDILCQNPQIAGLILHFFCSYLLHYAYHPPTISCIAEAKTPGWIALAVSPSGGMMGSDAVVAVPGGQLQSYALNGHDPSSVVPVSPGFQNGSLETSNETMTMR